MNCSGVAPNPPIEIGVIDVSPPVPLRGQLFCKNRGWSAQADQRPEDYNPDFNRRTSTKIMSSTRKTKAKTEFGDFQTPYDLAQKVCHLLAQQGVTPNAILEPNCGRGNFLLAALEAFPDAERIAGVELNEVYVDEALERLGKIPRFADTKVMHGDFFFVDWSNILSSLQDPILVLGNPPWITSAELSRIESANIPEKSNFQNHQGIDAITGRSNFDISEWMLVRELEWLQTRTGTLAMLCKTSVARKVLLHAWKNDLRMKQARIYLIDAPRHFGAAVDACLLVISTEGASLSLECQVYGSLEDSQPQTTIGYRDGGLVADLMLFERWRHLEGQDRYQWRSGIKHDAAKIMELKLYGDGYLNGLDEIVELEQDYLYPMFKSSEIANGSVQSPIRWMLIPQRTVGDSTREIQMIAPKTWSYLMTHSTKLDNRKSSIYRNRPRFSIFGVGNYSFSPWKVAISGFYKFFRFRVFGPFEHKPVVFDDTCYFLACSSENEARFLAELLNSELARKFYSAFVFWDAKRPITIALLRRLDLLVLARELGVEDIYRTFRQVDTNYENEFSQMMLPV